MAGLEISHILALINVGIIVVDIVIPLAVVLIVAGTLHNRSNAVTWSVVDRLFQRSWWPAILLTDSSPLSLSQVQTSISFLHTSSYFTTILLLISSIVTPLGLSTSLRTRQAYKEFRYVPDPSLFGRATVPRGDFNHTRLCGHELSRQVCPGQTNTNGLQTWRAEGMNTSWGMIVPDDRLSWFDSKVPDNITEIFSSTYGAHSESVSSLFDIQHRIYEMKVYNSTDIEDPSVDQGRPYVEGQFRYLQSIVLNDRYDIVEGLVVDSKKGGIGFRNHTMPIDVPLGATWKEKLLWLEPETACVNTNLTIDYTIAWDEQMVGDTLRGQEVLSDVHLTDRGGIKVVQDMRNRGEGPPVLDIDDAQEDPGLYMRAHSIGITLARDQVSFFNLTEADPPDDVGTKHRIPMEDISIGGLTHSIPWPNDRLKVEIIRPWEMSVIPLAWFTSYLENHNIEVLCTKSGGTDNANITNIAVSCGVFLGPAVRTDPNGSGRDFIREIGSQWSHPMYTCATTIRATIKDVTFSTNGTSTLDNLKVVDTQDISYDDGEDLPLWAVEKTGMPISDIKPFWGPVSPDYETHPNLWTRRSTHLYLPQCISLWPLKGTIAGAGAPQAALDNMYGNGLLGNSMPDYSGKASFDLVIRLKELSRSAETAALIPNLMWTDMMANSVVGSKSVLKPGRDGMTKTTLEVTFNEEKIVYDAVYAIPAVILCFIWIVYLVPTLLLWVTSSITIAALTQLLNQSSPGRAVTNLLYGTRDRITGEDLSGISTRRWVESAGKKKIGFENFGGEPVPPHSGVQYETAYYGDKETNGGLGGSGAKELGSQAVCVSTPPPTGARFVAEPEEAKIGHIFMTGGR